MALFTHKGIEIQVESSGKFVGVLEEATVSADSLDAVKLLIDKALTPEAKRKLSLPVLGLMTKQSYFSSDEDGNTVHKAVLTGINRTSKDFLLTGIPKDKILRHVVPDTPGCRAVLEAFIAARKQMEKATKQLEELKLSTKGFGRLELANYSEALDELMHDHALKSQLSKEKA